VTSFLALVSCTLFVGASWPDEQSVAHSIAFYDALTSNARAQIAESESAPNVGVRMPNGHVIYLKPEVVASRKTEALLQYQEAVTTELRSKQWRLLIHVFVTWFVSSLAVLVLGHFIAWVVRGFRESTKKSVG
jgi:hypothetical protein